MATTVTINKAGLLVGTQSLPIRAGAIHYWRTEYSSWGRCLDRARDVGLTIVESYVPWSVHEIARGGYDFGEIDRQKALPLFLEACAARGLRVILRPGPHINAEMTHFGFPQRILENPACLAQTANRTVAICPAPPRFFPIPSYAQKPFMDEVSQWLSAFARIIKPFLGGCVVAVQVDNEMSYFFRAGAFDLDYSEGSIALYREFIKGRYSKESAMSAAYGGNARFETLDPPRRFTAKNADDLPRFLDWAAYKQFYLVHAVAQMAKMLRDHGVRGVPLFHNLPPAEVTHPLSISQLEQHVDFVGIDLYHRRQEFQVVKRRVLALTGTSRLPIIPELGAGGWLAWQSFTPEDNQTTALTALMYGVKGVNFYMFVNRERWYGAPVSKDGQIKELSGGLPSLYSWMKQLFRSMREVSFEALTREVSVGVLLPSEYAALASVTSAVEPLTPFMFELFGFTQRDLAKEESFGLRSIVQREGPALVEAWSKALQGRSIAYSLIEGNQVPGHQRYKLLMVPTLDFLEEGLAAKLLAYAEAGGIVVIGPQLPDLDPKFLPSVAFAELGTQIAHERHASDQDYCTVPFGAGAFWFIEQRGFDSAESLSVIVQELIVMYQLGSALTVQNVEWTLYRDGAGQGRVVFLASACEQEKTAWISGEPFSLLTDALTGEVFIPIDGAFQVKVSAWTVRMLIATASLAAEPRSESA
jgi:beta-galactosidase